MPTQHYAIAFPGDTEPYMIARVRDGHLERYAPPKGWAEWPELRDWFTGAETGLRSITAEQAAEYERRKIGHVATQVTAERTPGPGAKTPAKTDPPPARKGR